MRLLTVATERNQYVYHWEHAARLHGWTQVEVLGEGRRWAGWTAYMGWIADALERYPPAELVLLTDAYDALVQRTPREAEAAYRTFGAPVVFGAERWCGHNCHRVAARRCGTTPWNVNGGVTCGPAGMLAGIYRAAHAANETDEQVALGKWFADNCALARLDTEGRLVANYGLHPSMAHTVMWDPAIDAFRTAAGHVPTVIHMPAQPVDPAVRSDVVRRRLIPGLGSTTAGPIGEAIMYSWRTINNPDNRSIAVGVVVAVAVLVVVAVVLILALRSRGP